MKTLKQISFLFLIGLSLASCKKLEVNKPESNVISKDLNKVRAADDFSWKTSTDYQFQLQGFINGVVKIVSPSGTVYYSGLIKAGTPSQIKLTLPSYEKNIVIRYLANERTVSLGQGVIVQSFDSFN